MIKTVCDICDSTKGEMYHCTIPIPRRFESEWQGVIFEKFEKIEVKEIDLCKRHWMMLNDFIETMKENPDV